MQPLTPSPFVNKHGTYHYRIARLVDAIASDFSKEWPTPIRTIEDVRAMARAGVFSPSEIFRYRGTGSVSAPSKIMLFIFPDNEQVMSRAQRLREKVLAFLGDGI